MAQSLNEAIEAAEFPAPQNGEDLALWARRVALVGAHIGAAHALTHRPPTVVHVQADPVPSADLTLNGEGTTD